MPGVSYSSLLHVSMLYILNYSNCLQLSGNELATVVLYHNCNAACITTVLHVRITMVLHV